MKKLILCAALCFCVSAPALVLVPTKTMAATTQPARQKLFNAETFSLNNGMQVVVIPNHRAPVAIAMVWYKVGSSDEIQGKTGLAHFLEHLMFKGSPNVPPGELSRRVRSLGGSDNAFTTHDYTAYFQTVAVQHLENVMSMEADRMKAITIPPDQFGSEQQVVLEERRQRTENDPRSYFFDQLRYALYPAHPYSVPVIGWEQDIKTLTRDDALAWHNKWYVPNNAILVVAGDVTAAQIKPLAEKIYGSIPARPVMRTTLPKINEFPGETRLALRDPRVRQGQIIRLYRAPSSTENKKDSLALSVLVEIMSGGASTRLYKSLVVDQKIATSATLRYEDTSLGTTTVSASLSPAEGIAREKAEAALDQELQKLAKNGVTPQELSEAKTRLKDSAAFTRDSLSTPAHIIGEALASGLSLDDVEYWTYDIDSVTADQVKSVAQKYLTPGNTPDAKPAFVTGVIIPSEGTEKSPETPPTPAQQEVR